MYIFCYQGVCPLERGSSLSNPSVSVSASVLCLVGCNTCKLFPPIGLNGRQKTDFSLPSNKFYVSFVVEAECL